VVRRLLAWEQAQADAGLSDVFGYHALQASGLGLDLLRQNRMPHRWRARNEFDDSGTAHALAFDSRAWPWGAESLDLVVLAHTLERSADPHACLREVERVLIPEGQVFITGFNPSSLWGWRLMREQRRSPGRATWPLQPIACHRVRDWLNLLGFEVQQTRFISWTPRWMDPLARRWGPLWGDAYMLIATKRVPGGLRLQQRQWGKVPSRPALVAPAARLDTSAQVTPSSES
jgi:SAM-dependent methyltransferase